jgi:regulator of replication initiation timing
MTAHSLSQKNPQSNQFHDLLGEIKQEVDGLKAKIVRLEQEKKHLGAELRRLQKKENDPFSAMENTDRMVLKHQIEGLITRIEKHLNHEQ